MAACLRPVAPEHARRQKPQVENLLAEQPGSLPAVDVVVDDFELRGRKLGRIEIRSPEPQRRRGQREWRLGKFNITTLKPA